MKALIFLLIATILWANPYKNFENYKLQNGLEVYLLSDPKAKNVSITVDVKVGMKAEDKKSAGLSHLTEHLVFRDQRVKYHDFYDYLSEEGATDINGYTSYYKTSYVATIDGKKAYFLLENFAKMLFDKNVTKEDLEVEKKALQIEIGEPKWSDNFEYIGRAFKSVGKFLKDIFPKPYTINNDFGIDEDREKIEYLPRKIYKTNNKKFTLNEVLKHYQNYYYPANMTLTIVGKFDNKKMKELIAKTFGSVERKGNKSVKKPHYKDAKLSNKPFIFYDFEDEPSIAIGTKFLADNPKKTVILRSYITYLADRINREFRNKYGESYSVYGSAYDNRGAGVASIYFITPRDVFYKNLNYVKKIIKDETNGKISDEIIKKSIQNSLKYIESKEHDIFSLSDTITTYKIFKEDYNATIDDLPYNILTNITTDEYRKILKDTFKPTNSYMRISEPYIFFPYEIVVISLIFLLIYIILIFRFSKVKINKKDIRLKLRLSNKFIGIGIFVLIIITTIVLEEWIFVLLHKALGLYPVEFYLNKKEQMIVFTIESILAFVILYIVVKKLFSWYHSTLVVTDEKLYLVGSKPKIVDLDKIQDIKTAKWSIKNFFKTYGFSFLFWRDTVMIKTEDDLFYIRSFKAKDLEKTLKKLIQKRVVTDE